MTATKETPSDTERSRQESAPEETKRQEHERFDLSRMSPVEIAAELARRSRSGHAPVSEKVENEREPFAHLLYAAENKLSLSKTMTSDHQTRQQLKSAYVEEQFRIEEEERARHGLNDLRSILQQREASRPPAFRSSVASPTEPGGMLTRQVWPHGKRFDTRFAAEPSFQSGNKDEAPTTPDLAAIGSKIVGSAKSSAPAVPTILNSTDNVSMSVDEATPDKATPDKATPDKATPDKATPDKATPDKATPDKATPGQDVPPVGKSTVEAQRLFNRRSTDRASTVRQESAIARREEQSAADLSEAFDKFVSERIALEKQWMALHAPDSRAPSWGATNLRAPSLTTPSLRTTSLRTPDLRAPDLGVIHDEQRPRYRATTSPEPRHRSRWKRGLGVCLVLAALIGGPLFYYYPWISAHWRDMRAEIQAKFADIIANFQGGNPASTNGPVPAATGTTDQGAPTSTTPTSTTPTSTNPGSTNPGSTNPGSTNPGSTNPGSTNPGSANQGSTGQGLVPATTQTPAAGESATAPPGAALTKSSNPSASPAPAAPAPAVMMTPLSGKVTSPTAPLSAPVSAPATKDMSAGPQSKQKSAVTPTPSTIEHKTLNLKPSPAWMKAQPYDPDNNGAAAPSSE